MLDAQQLREIDRDVVGLKVGVAQLSAVATNLGAQLTQMQTTVTDLTVKVAQAATLAQQLRDLQANVDSLNRALERGRGAIWALTTVAATVGAVIGMVANAIFKLVGKD